MKRILIVEDDQIVANIYRNKLSVDGFEAEIALDGETGLELVQSFQPDAILMDLMLPRMSGVDLMRKIRLEKGFEQIPVIVFSNTYLTNLVQEAWRAGATKCLSKANCTPKQVIEVLRGVLGTNGTKPANAAPAPAAHPGSSRPAPSQPVAPVAHRQPQPLPAPDSDAAFQENLQRSFTESLTATMQTLRMLLQSLVKADNEMTRVKQAQELYRRIHALTGNAAVSGFPDIAQMADVLQALLKELYEKPKNLNPSTLRTVASAVDFLGLLFERPNKTTPLSSTPPNILVVDDEAISRRAITYALERTKLKCVNVEDPSVALQLLTDNTFDLIFLDVDMPGMNGFELCTRLRSLPAHTKTPVIFVTSLNDFECRANSTMSGGNDFIAKPFLFLELAVKALVYIMRGRLKARP